MRTLPFSNLPVAACQGLGAGSADLALASGRTLFPLLRKNYTRPPTTKAEQSGAGAARVTGYRSVEGWATKTSASGT